MIFPLLMRRSPGRPRPRDRNVARSPPVPAPPDQRRVPAATGARNGRHGIAGLTPPPRRRSSQRAAPPASRGRRPPRPPSRPAPAPPAPPCRAPAPACGRQRPAGEQVIRRQRRRGRAGRPERARQVEAGVIVDRDDAAVRDQQVRVLGGAVDVLQEAVGAGDRLERRRGLEVGRGRGRASGTNATARFQPVLRCSIESNSSVPAIQGKPSGSSTGRATGTGAPNARAIPRARYSVSTPNGPGPAPVNFITQRRPSAVSISAGEVLARGQHREDARDARVRRDRVRRGGCPCAAPRSSCW